MDHHVPLRGGGRHLVSLLKCKKVTASLTFWLQMGSLSKLFIHCVCLTPVQKVESVHLSLVRTIGVNSKVTELEFWRISDRNLIVTETLCWYLECDRLWCPCVKPSPCRDNFTCSQYPFGPGALVDMEIGNRDSSRWGTRNSFFIHFCACEMTGCGNLSCIVVIECKSSKGVLWSQAECWEVLTASDGSCMWYVTTLPPHPQIQKYSAGYLLKVFSHPKIVVNKCY